jgi:hypothetical protein
MGRGVVIADLAFFLSNGCVCTKNEHVFGCFSFSSSSFLLLFPFLSSVVDEISLRSDIAAGERGDKRNSRKTGRRGAKLMRKLIGMEESKRAHPSSSATFPS